MQWRVGLVALVFVGTAAGQIGGLPELPELGLPDPPVAVPSAPIDVPDSGVTAGLVPDTDQQALRIPDGSAQAGAPLLEYQHLIWRDGQNVLDIPRDGYDLIELRAWEADELGFGAGLMLRLEVRGNALAGLDQYIIQGDLVVPESNATPTILLWTEDGESWQSDGTIVHQGYTANGTSVLGSPQHHVIHVLYTLDALNVSIGQSIGGWRFSAYADSEAGVKLTDIAPGGYTAGSNIELPEPNAAGDIDDESLSSTATEPPVLLMRGAGQHLGISGLWAQGVVTMVLTNPYVATDQFVAVAYPPQASPLSGTNGTLLANRTLTFQFAVPQQSSAYVARWDVRSDIGGVALVEVVVPALPPPAATPTPTPTAPAPVPLERTDLVVSPTPTPAATPSAPAGKGSPGLGIGLLLGAVGLALWARRK